MIPRQIISIDDRQVTVFLEKFSNLERDMDRDFGLSYQLVEGAYLVRRTHEGTDQLPSENYLCISEKVPSIVSLPGRVLLPDFFEEANAELFLKLASHD